MIYFASTLHQLKKAIESFEKSTNSTEALVGREYINYNRNLPEKLFDNLIQLELVYMNKDTGEIVGDESNDYKLTENDVAVVLIK
jgi:hypothetical protein